MKCVNNTRKRVAVGLLMAALLCMLAVSAIADEKLPVAEKNGEAVFELGAAEAVRLYTYTVYESDGNEAGTMQLRYGRETGHYGVRLWITVGGNETELENEPRFFTTYGELTIKDTVWSEFFAKEPSAYTYTAESVELPSIPAPASVRWDTSGKPGVIVWDDVEAADGKYVLEMMRGEDSEARVSTLNSHQRMDFSDDINESGSLVVAVRAVGGRDTGDSNLVYSPAYIYTRPEEVLGETQRVWWTTKPGETLATVINWNPVAGAGGYKISLRGSEELATGYFATVYNTGKGLATSYDWTRVIKKLNTEFGAMSYICQVRALSGNIEVVANAPESSYTTSSDNETANGVEEIEDALKDAKVSDVLEVIDEKGIDSVAAAMQSEQTVLDTVKTLEEAYSQANDIEVKEPEVTHPDLDKSGISVVGAGINAVSGSAIGLNFSKLSLDEEKPVNDKLYKNAVQVSITLENNETPVTGRLKCPVAITMPVPKGIDLDRLVIIHYHADGSYEYIYPAKNADGTVTFSVTSFSTFVFAELVVYEGGDSGNTENEQENNNSTHYSSSSSSALETGIQTYGAVKKFVKPDGRFAQNEWVKRGNTWYLAGADGVLQTGWYRNADGVWYYLSDSCAMATGWQLIDGLWYYLDPVNGDMKTGWLQTADGKWYFLKENGDMKTGWLLTADGKWYCLGADGACLMNTTTPDGYAVDANGAWIP